LSPSILPRKTPSFKGQSSLFSHFSEPGDPPPLGGDPPPLGRPAAPSRCDLLTRRALAGDRAALGRLIDQVTEEIDDHDQAAAWHIEQAAKARRARDRLTALIPSDQEGGQ
jgi:hypothetical protein